MAIQTRRNTPVKQEKAARYGAVGVIVGKVKSIEFTKYGERETVRTKILLGQTEVRANSSREEVMTALDGVLEGDEVGLFGFFSSRPDQKDQSKVWSDFRIHRVDIDDIKGPSKVTLFGKIIQTAKVGWGTWLDLDISDRPDYPTMARVLVPDDVAMPTTEEDAEIKCLARPSGRFGDMTVYQFLDPKEEFTRRVGNAPVGNPEKLSRFCRNGGSDVTRATDPTPSSDSAASTQPLAPGKKLPARDIL